MLWLKLLGVGPFVALGWLWDRFVRPRLGLSCGTCDHWQRNSVTTTDAPCRLTGMSREAHRTCRRHVRSGWLAGYRAGVIDLCLALVGCHAEPDPPKWTIIMRPAPNNSWRWEAISDGPVRLTTREFGTRAAADKPGVPDVLRDALLTMFHVPANQVRIVR